MVYFLFPSRSFCSFIHSTVLMSFHFFFHLHKWKERTEFWSNLKEKKITFNAKPNQPEEIFSVSISISFIQNRRACGLFPILMKNKAITLISNSLYRMCNEMGRFMLKFDEFFFLWLMSSGRLFSNRIHSNLFVNIKWKSKGQQSSSLI